jgi:hypothetical protein
MFSNEDREGFIEFTKKIALANVRVLEERAKGVLEEVEGFLDDVWEYEGEVKDENIQLYIITILQPVAYGVYIDLLIGNLLAFFMELRLLLESLAYCYMAKFFPGDYSLNKIYQHVSTSKVIKEFGEMARLGNEPIKLWGKLSEDWCHALEITEGGPKGMIARVIEHLDRYFIPPFSSIPLLYEVFWEETSYLIDEAGKRMSEFRQILKSVITKTH